MEFSKQGKQDCTSELAWQFMEWMTQDQIGKDEHCHVCLSEFHEDDGTEKETEGEIVHPTKKGRTESQFDCVKLVRCNGHYFHSQCIAKWFKEKPRCPSCTEFYGEEKGIQPDGTMQVSVNKQALPGYPGCGTIVIVYAFPDGVQGPQHPNPGKRYHGTHRYAFLPDNEEGRKVCDLLRRAFNNRVVFTIGTSLTTGMPNCVIWNGIHHKTSPYGGAFGYPDPTYLNRVTLELASKGIV